MVNYVGLHVLTIFVVKPNLWMGWFSWRFNNPLRVECKTSTCIIEVKVLTGHENNVTMQTSKQMNELINEMIGPKTGFFWGEIKPGVKYNQCWVNIGQNTCWVVFNQQLG